MTIYVVRKSTHQNIETNKSLIDAQLALKIRELIIQSENQKVDKLRDCASAYFAAGMKLNNECISAVEEVYHLQNRENSLEKIKQLIKSNYYDFSTQAHTVFVYLDINNDIDQIIKNEIFDVQKKAWGFYSTIGIDYEESLILLDELARQFGYTQKLLIDFIKKLKIDIYKKD